MKLAFSNTGCPDWDLATLIAKAKEFGYDGIELAGLPGRQQLPIAPELAADPAGVAKQAAQAGVEIACLATAAGFSSADPRVVAENQALVCEYVALAAALHCPFVRVFPGALPQAGLLLRQRRDTVLGRIGAAIRELGAHAFERGVTIVVENAGDFADSPSAWYLVDAADSPSVRCCWNPMTARAHGERPTRSIPRLNSRIGLVRVGDFKLNDRGAIDEPVLPGRGDGEVCRLVQLLKGIAYRGYLVFDWPKHTNPSLADATEVFPATARYLRDLLNEQTVQLTAYKGDKFKPRQGGEFAQSPSG
jgi:sugar phosphate isomerase/epimerase